MQLPHNWGPLPPPGWGGLPANGSVNYTWTPSADGGGLFWDGKSGNAAKASNVNPAQAIASAKDDVSDAVAVRHCAGVPMCTHLCNVQCSCARSTKSLYEARVSLLSRLLAAACIVWHCHLRLYLQALPCLGPKSS